MLKNKGIKYIVADVDQTIVPQSSNIITEDIYLKLEEIKSIFGDNAICFLTNEPSEERHNILLKKTNIPVVDTRGERKPMPEAFIYALKLLNKDALPQEICFIGDRIWTDIIGANSVNFYTVKVEPFDPISDRYITKLLRHLENVSIYFLQQNHNS